MRESFLFKISKILFSKYKNNLSELVIVLPSRRSMLFFVEEFSKFISKPIWLPKFYSIDDFIFNINDLKKINNLELFLKFYNIYKNKIDAPHDIEKCYKWAHRLLEDFNDTRIKYIKNYSHTGVSSSRYLGVLKSSNNQIQILIFDRVLLYFFDANKI